METSNFFFCFFFFVKIFRNFVFTFNSILRLFIGSKRYVVHGIVFKFAVDTMISQDPPVWYVTITRKVLPI